RQGNVRLPRSGLDVPSEPAAAARHLPRGHDDQLPRAHRHAHRRRPNRAVGRVADRSARGRLGAGAVMAKRTKFQAEMLLRAAPVSAFDVLREVAARLEITQTFPPGILAAVGQTISTVIDEADQVRAIKAEDKRQAALAVVEPEKAGGTA